jgi:hypothetical protein
MSDEQVQSESDNPQVLFIAGAVLAVVVVIAAIVVGVDQFYKFSIRDEISKQELQPVDARLPELRKQEKHDLTSYQYVNKEKTIIRIPIDDAVRLTLQDWASRPAGVAALPAAQNVPVVPPPAPAPTDGTPK